MAIRFIDEEPATSGSIRFLDDPFSETNPQGQPSDERIPKVVPNEPRDLDLEMTSVDFQRERLDPLEKSVSNLNLDLMEPGMRQSMMKQGRVSSRIAERDAAKGKLSQIKEAEDSAFMKAYPPGSIEEISMMGKTKDGKQRPLSQQFKVAAKVILIHDNRERAEAFKGMGLDVKDMEGRQIVTMPDGEEFVVNYPGMSPQDAFTIAESLAEAISPAKWIAGAKGILGKTGRLLAGEAATATAHQGVEKLAGGSADALQGATDAVFGIAGEALGSLIKAGWKGISADAAQKALQTKTLSEMMETLNMDKKAVLKMIQEAKDLPKDSPLLIEVERVLSLSKLEAAARSDPGKAIEVTDYLDASTLENAEDLQKIFQRSQGLKPSNADKQIQASIKNSVKKIGNRRIDTDKLLTDGQYNKAFEGVPPVDVTKERSDLLAFIEKETNPGSPERSKLMSFYKQLGTDVDENPILDEFGREILDFKKDPRRIQDVVRGIRDLREIVNDSSVNSSVRLKTKTLLDALVNKLNTVSKGEYNKADKLYSQIKELQDKFLKRGFEEGAEITDGASFDQFQKSIFDPSEGGKPDSKRFMSLLYAKEPEAAKNLWANNYGKKLGALGKNAKPSAIKKELFGEGSMIYDLAPGPIHRKALKDLEKLLDVGEQFEGITVKEATDKWVQGQLDPIAAHWVYVRMGIFRSLKSARDKDLATAWFAAVTDPKWMEGFEKALGDPKIIAQSRSISADARKKAADGTAERARAIFDGFTARHLNTGNLKSSSGVLSGAAVSGAVDSDVIGEEDTFTPPNINL